MTNHGHEDTLDRLDAMRVQGETMKVSNYFRNRAAGDDLNESCRGAMVTWIRQVQKTLELSPESVWIGLSYFDRYLASGRGRSREALRSRSQFQLAAITAFYTAVKIHEPVVLGLNTLVQICRETYSKSDVMAMERDLLAALDWRVSCHTPMEFARHLLELLPEELPPRAADALLEECRKNVDRTLPDVHFASFAPWVVGTSCLATSLSDSDVLSPSEKQACSSRLSELCDFNLASKEVAAVRQRLQPFASPKKSDLARKLSQVSLSKAKAPSSPVCVTRAARQA